MIFHRRLSLIIIFAVNLLCLTSVSAQAIHDSYISISPDGRMVAVANNITIQIYNVDTLQVMNIFTNLEHQITEPSWSPDGLYLAFGNAFNIEIWQEAWNPNMTQLSVILQTDWYIRSLDWSPNGNMIAVGNSGLEVWDVSTAQRLYAKYEHNLFLTDVVWSPDNTQLVTTSADNTLKIWDASSGTVVSTMSLATNSSAMPISELYQSALSLSWQSDGTKLAIGVSDGTVRILDTSAPFDANFTSYWEEPNVISVHEDAIWTVSWNPEGTHIASATFTGTVVILNVSTYEMSEPISLDTRVFSLVWASNCEDLFFADNKGMVQILNLTQITILD